MNIFVGNLDRDVSEQELRDKFAEFGEVISVSIVKDRHSGLSRGFAFVEMASSEEGQAAIDNLKGKTLKERTLDIAESQPQGKGRGGRGGPRRGGGKHRRY